MLLRICRIVVMYGWKNMCNIRVYLGVMMAGVVLAGVSCTTFVSAPEPSPVVSSVFPPAEVLLDAGDEIEIKFPYHSELNESVKIRPDGKIALQIVDDLQAAGLTPEQLDDELTKLYTKEIHNPSLTVLVRNLVNQRIFVGGEVQRPGSVPVNGRLSVMEAVVLAGGFDLRSAKPGDIVVIRNVGEKRYGTVLDLNPALKGKPHTPFYLAANDIVLVPRTGISHINQWVDQYINQLLPATYIRVQWRKGTTTYGYGR